MTQHNLNLGHKGEGLAEAFLKRQGYKIRKSNFRIKIGEIDIIAEEGDTICFIEVKTRDTPFEESPLEAIDERKQHRISRAALAYIQKHKLHDRNARFDCLAITGSGSGAEIELIKDAFELSNAYFT